MTTFIKKSVSPKYVGIEGLRFLLSFLVLLYHYFYYGPTVGIVSKFAYGGEALVYGRFAVSAFFIISGFVIFFSAHGRSYSDFFRARFIRLAPSLILCSTVTFVVLRFFQNGVEVPSVLAYLKSVSVFGVLLGGGMADPSYWSIVFELRFYVYVGLLLMLFGSLNRILPFIVIWIITSCIACFYSNKILDVLTLTPHSAFFLLGILLYYICSGKKLVLCYLGTFCVLVLAGVQTFKDYERIDMLDGIRSPIWISFAIALISYLLVLLALRMPNNLPGVAIIKKLGAMSYPLYLIHQGLGYWLMVVFEKKFGPAGSIYGGIFACSCAILFAWTFVSFAERKGMLISGWLWDHVSSSVNLIQSRLRSSRTV